MEYLLHVAVVAAIYAILTLDLLAGRTGLLSISHAASIVWGRIPLPCFRFRRVCPSF